MLYQVIFDIDRQALGSGENAMKVRAAETERAVKAQREGKLIAAAVCAKPQSECLHIVSSC